MKKDLSEQSGYELRKLEEKLIIKRLEKEIDKIIPTTLFGTTKESVRVAEVTKLYNIYIKEMIKRHFQEQINKMEI